MGTDIDTIFKMLSWNSSEKEQLRGIDEAKKIEYLSVLFQPIEDKSVWENCAKVNWLDYLSGLIENPEVYKLLPEEYQKLMTKYYNDFWKE